MCLMTGVVSTTTVLKTVFQIDEDSVGVNRAPVMGWPSQSIHLTPIKRLWYELKKSKAEERKLRTSRTCDKKFEKLWRGQITQSQFGGSLLFKLIQTTFSFELTLASSSASDDRFGDVLSAPTSSKVFLTSLFSNSVHLSECSRVMCFPVLLLYHWTNS